VLEEGLQHSPSPELDWTISKDREGRKGEGNGEGKRERKGIGKEGKGSGGEMKERREGGDTPDF